MVATRKQPKHGNEASAPLKCRGICHDQCRHIDNAAHRGRGGENVYGGSRTEQHGPDRHAIGRCHLQHVEQNVRRIQVRADQQIGFSLQGGFSQGRAEHRLGQCRITLQLTVALHVGRQLSKQLARQAHFAGTGPIG